jgi:hypothetical protein
MKPSIKWLIAILVVIALVAAALFWWQQRASELTAAPPKAMPVQAVKPAPMVAAPEPAPRAPPAAAPVAPPPILHPIEAVAAPATRPPVPLPKLAESDQFLKDALTELLSRKSVLSFLNTDNFVRRSVATVDNLAQGHAAASLWPVIPTPGRFMIVERADGIYMNEGNSERYTPFVRFATSIDTAKAAALYTRLYPLFQQAYEELGYPGQYFNDRVVAVIDHLLKTPELTDPIKLTLTEVQGSVPSSQPWLRYEFDDPALEALPAGQKILIRVGHANELLLKAKLREFRERIVKRKSSR